MWKKIILPAAVVLFVIIMIVSGNVTGQNNEKRLKEDGVVTAATPVTVVKRSKSDTSFHSSRNGADRYRYSPMFKYTVKGESFNIYGKAYIREDDAVNALHAPEVTVRYVKDDPSIAEVIQPEVGK